MFLLVSVVRRPNLQTENEKSGFSLKMANNCCQNPALCNDCLPCYCVDEGGFPLGKACSLCLPPLLGALPLIPLR